MLDAPISPVCSWAPSAAFRPVPQPSSAASELCEISVCCSGLQGGGHCSPVALLLDISTRAVLLGRTEWRHKAESPVFAGLICFDAAALGHGATSKLELQIRHVEEPFWDQRDADEAAALSAMPLLGRAAFRFGAALEAENGTLRLRLEGGAPVTDAPSAPPPTALLCVRSAAGWPCNRLVARHSSVNYRFRCSSAGDGPAGTPSREAAVRSPRYRSAPKPRSSRPVVDPGTDMYVYIYTCIY